MEVAAAPQTLTNRHSCNISQGTQDKICGQSAAQGTKALSHSWDLQDKHALVSDPHWKHVKCAAHLMLLDGQQFCDACCHAIDLEESKML